MKEWISIAISVAVCLLNPPLLERSDDLSNENLRDFQTANGPKNFQPDLVFHHFVFREKDHSPSKRRESLLFLATMKLDLYFLHCWSPIGRIQLGSDFCNGAKSLPFHESCTGVCRGFRSLHFLVQCSWAYMG